MKIIKANGDIVPLDFSQVTKQTKPATEGLKNVDYKTLEEDTKVLLRDRMATSEITRNLITTALNKVDIDRSDWTYVAARLELYSLYHNIKRIYNRTGSGDVYKMASLNMFINKYKDIGKERLGDFVNKYTEDEISELNNYIVGERDLLMNYFSVKTALNMYLFKVKGDIVELPQYLHMGVAMYLAQNEKDKMYYVKEFYDMFSKFEFINSTPTNANSRSRIPSTISCLINRIPDSIKGIFDAFKEIGLGSQQGSGWGIDWTFIRSKGSYIDGIKGIAGGKIAFLKTLAGISIAVDQRGKEYSV